MKSKKNKFIKNLYQILSFGCCVLVFVIILLAVFFVSLSYEENYGWLSLLISLMLIILFFIFGFFWIFQTIEINKNGIKVKLFKKIIRDILWDDVLGINYAGVMRNPAYVVTIKNDKNLNLDCRKKIKEAFICYGNERIKNMAIELIK